jgi:hypothetical protein
MTGTPKYKPCYRCAEYRASGDWDFALKCSNCDGKGVVRTVSSYPCNNCGGSMSDGEGEQGWPMGLVEETVGGGYNSFHLTDCTSYTFSICEKCLRAMFVTFKIPPTVQDRLGGDGGYAEDLDFYQYRLWEAAGGDVERLLAGGCNWREHCHEPAVWRCLSHGKLRDRSRCDAHKWHGVGYGGERLARFSDVPFLKAETEDEIAREAWAWKTGGEHPIEEVVDEIAD